MKFYRCRHCGNIITYVEDKGVRVVCCGEEMQELVAGTVDASKEKHIPVVTVEGRQVSVKVGSVDHPMTAEHHIAWIAIETSKGSQRKSLGLPGAPAGGFCLAEGEEFIAAYEYCNLHGLWKA